jgi:hypothetical protein
VLSSAPFVVALRIIKVTIPNTSSILQLWPHYYAVYFALVELVMMYFFTKPRALFLLLHAFVMCVMCVMCAL